MTVGELDVSRETTERLQHLVDLVRKWSPKINLVSPSQLHCLWQRHVWDCAQLVSHAPPDPRRWVDLGSGGGFPGLVVSALALDRGWSTTVFLVESDQRKAAFLRRAATEMGVMPRVLATRSEQVVPLSADVLSARAFAPLDRLLTHAVRHVAPDGVTLLPKGSGHEAEIAAARRHWRFTCDRRSSITDPDAAILKLTEINRA